MSLECSDTLRLYTYVHRPGIEPGSHPWQGCILPLDHRCSGAFSKGRAVRWKRHSAMRISMR
jgi:hypothetical protein